MQNSISTNILTDQTADGISKSIPSAGFRNILVTLNGKSNPAFTVKVRQSQSKYAIEDITHIPSHYTIGVDTIVCFQEPAGEMTVTDWKGNTHVVDNAWQEVEAIYLLNGDDYDGDIGIVFSGTNTVMEFEVNTNRVGHFALEVSGYTAGELTADVVLTDNL